VLADKLSVMTPTRSNAIHRNNHERGEVAISDADLPFADMTPNKSCCLTNGQDGSELAMYLDHDLWRFDAARKELGKFRNSGRFAVVHIHPLVVDGAKGRKPFAHELMDAARIHER
jgi:hypothetical protein